MEGNRAISVNVVCDINLPRNMKHDDGWLHRCWAISLMYSTRICNQYRQSLYCWLQSIQCTLDIRNTSHRRHQLLLQAMQLIDAIQLLGVDYHFQKEISEAISKVYDADFNNHGLYKVALWFRLLRQPGYNIFPGNILRSLKVKSCKNIEVLNCPIVSNFFFEVIISAIVSLPMTNYN